MTSPVWNEDTNLATTIEASAKKNKKAKCKQEKTEISNKGSHYDSSEESVHSDSLQQSEKAITKKIKKK